MCKCSDTQPPGNLDLEKIPMMVGITFNGIITPRTMMFIKQILNPIFKNPNGCPSQATFFVSDKMNTQQTDYCVVQSLFNNNNEIAVGSIKYNCPYTDCESLGKHHRKWNAKNAQKLIYEQKKNIARKAKINRSFLKGFRVPYLDQAGSTHFRALKKYAFNYDSSVVIKQKDIMRNEGNMRFWPHTLDFPPSYECKTCPSKASFCQDQANCTMNSVWIVPLHFLSIETLNPCPTLIKDEIAANRIDTKHCLPRNELKQELIEKMLFENFESHYNLNKAPFILNLETEWFDEFGEMLTKALRSFVNELTSSESKYGKKKDIYFMSISKIIEWIQYPVELDVIGNEWLWDCDDSSFDYDEECESIIKLKEMNEELEEIKQKNKTNQLKLDLQAENLFHNGIFSIVFLAFIIGTLLTVCYDKFG